MLAIEDLLVPFLMVPFLTEVLKFLVAAIKATLVYQRCVVVLFMHFAVSQLAESFVAIFPGASKEFTAVYQAAPRTKTSWGRVRGVLIIFFSCDPSWTASFPLVR